MKISAIVVAAGNATRFACDKMALPLADSTVCQAAVRAFTTHPDVSQVVLVVPQDKVPQYRTLLADCTVVAGGKTRAESVQAGLRVATGDHVLVHDGARPNVSRALIDRVLCAMGEHSAVVPTIATGDSLVGPAGYCDRSQYRLTQTPQGFETALLRKCFADAQRQFTDEGALVAETVEVYQVEGDAANRKLTYPVDYYGIRGDLRYGIGYDIHRLKEGRRLVLGGIEIDYKKGLDGHSDADCCLHALMDAALSAMGLADIGHYFPNTPQWKDADSADLLANVMQTLAQKNARIVAASMSIIAEAPRLGPYIDVMRKHIAALLQIDPDAVGIGATTNEGVPMPVADLATTEAIACIAEVTVQTTMDV